jgi:hypothetical protein
VDRLRRDHPAPARDGSHGLNVSAWLPALFLAVWPTLAVVFLARTSLDVALGAAAVAASGVTLAAAQQVLSELGSGPDLAARSAGTISDSEHVARAWRRFLRRTIFLAAPFAAAAWLALPDLRDLGRTSLALLAVVGGWATVVAGTATVIAFTLLRRLTGLGPLLNITVVAAAFSPILPTTLPTGAWLALSLTPGGWVAQLLRHGVERRDVSAWAWLVPIALLAALIPIFVRRLRSSYRVAEVVFVSGVGYVARLESD